MRRASSWRAICCVAIVGTSSLSLARGHADLAVDDLDQLHELSEVLPDARAKFERAEAARLRGDVQLALALYSELTDEAPDYGVLHRRRCELLAAMGDQAEARRACQRALSGGGNAAALRAMVRVLMMGEGAPPEADLALARRLASKALEYGPNDVWGHAASCEIARRLGDVPAYEACLSALTRVAPGHLETLAAQRDAPARVLWRAWLVPAVWSLLLLAAIATGVLLWSRRRASAAALGAACVLSLAGGPSAQAQQMPTAVEGEAFEVPPLEEAFENPLRYGYAMMLLADLADTARSQGRYDDAIKHYEKLVEAAPGKAAPLLGLCKTYELMGNRDKAFESCRESLRHEGAVVEDYVRTVGLLLEKPGPLSDEESSDAYGLADHVIAEHPDFPQGYRLQCDVALRMSHAELLTACSEELARLTPDDPKTVSLQWASAMARSDLDEAERLLARAEAVGVPSESVAIMRDAVARKLPWFLRAVSERATTIGLATVLAALVCLMLVLRRGARSQRAATSV